MRNFLKNSRYRNQQQHHNYYLTTGNRFVRNENQCEINLECRRPLDLLLRHKHEIHVNVGHILTICRCKPK